MASSSSPTSFFFIFFFIFFCPSQSLMNLSTTAIYASDSSELIPPLGNSVFLKTSAENGWVRYECGRDGKWAAAAMSADLRDLSTGNIVGTFAQGRGNSGTWTVLNNDGDRAESGHLSSIVSGAEIAEEARRLRELPDILAQATGHEFPGTMSEVAYVSRAGTRGGARPDDGAGCETAGAAELVAFASEFRFWKQDAEPPPVPVALAVPGPQRLVQGLYAQGSVAYSNYGIGWHKAGVNARLYDVPGGTRLGSFFTRKRGGSLFFFWRLDGPDGFTLVGSLAALPLPVSPDCLPWSLHSINSTLGNSTNLGPYTYVQMVSTKGGLPPSTSLPPMGITTKKKGRIWRSPFSAIFWFYANM